MHTALILRHKHQRVKVLDGPMVLYYLLTNTLRFWLDLLSVVPFIYLLVVLGTPSLRGDGNTQGASWVGFLSLVRLVRLMRLVSLSRMVISNTLSGRFQDLVQRLNLTVPAMYVILLCYCLAIVLNLEACIMLLIAYLEGVDNSWLTSVSWEDFTAVTEAEQWYAAVYWVITTVRATVVMRGCARAREPPWPAASRKHVKSSVRPPHVCSSRAVDHDGLRRLCAPQRDGAGVCQPLHDHGHGDVWPAGGHGGQLAHARLGLGHKGLQVSALSLSVVGAAWRVRPGSVFLASSVCTTDAACACLVSAHVSASGSARR